MLLPSRMKSRLQQVHESVLESAARGERWIRGNDWQECESSGRFHLRCDGRKKCRASAKLCGQSDLVTRFRLLNEEAKELTEKTLRDTLLNFHIASRDSRASPCHGSCT